MNTYKIDANGSVHVEGCGHSDSIKYLSGGYSPVEAAMVVAAQDFDRVKVAPCAVKARQKDIAEAEALALSNVPETLAEVETPEGQLKLEKAAKAASAARKRAEKEAAKATAEGIAKAIRSLTPGDPEYRPLTDKEINMTDQAETPETVEAPTVLDALLTGAPLPEAPVSDHKSRVKELKAIRMRQLWTFQRAQRRAEKAQAEGSPDAAKLVKIAAAEAKKERAAYETYRKALTSGK